LIPHWWWFPADALEDSRLAQNSVARREIRIIGAQNAHAAGPDALDDEKYLDDCMHLEIGVEEAGMLPRRHECLCSSLSVSPPPVPL